MSLKGILSTRSAVVQLLVLLFLIAGGILLTNGVYMGIFYTVNGLEANISEQPAVLRWYQFVSATGTFLIPSLLAAWLFSNNPKKYLFIQNFPSLKITLLVLLCLILISPAINLTGLINKSITLPAFLEPLEQKMQLMEAEAERLTEVLLSGNGIGVLLSNLVVVAIAAAITEEFLFRGVLQRIFSIWFANPYAVIWLIAFIFSAFHLQFYGIIPRMLLGAFFGYLLLWSKNIWIPVFAHFANNAFGVFIMSGENWKNNDLINGEIPEGMLTYYIIVAAIFFFLFTIVIIKLKKELTALKNASS